MTPRNFQQLAIFIWSVADLLLEPDTHVLTQAGKIVTICDPACGTSGMPAER
ncbi:MAG: hypothetical protein ACU841_15005 [Gammaproteobacteria bacterium]